MEEAADWWNAGGKGGLLDMTTCSTTNTTTNSTTF